MKLVLPKEHGAWAMWIAPYVIGVFVTDFKLEHIIMLTAIFFGYIAISPFLQGIRKPNSRKEMWRLSAAYLAIAGVLGVPILFLYPKLTLIILMVIPFFLINLYYLKQRNERAFLNDLAAIVSLNYTLLVSYYIGFQQYDTRVFSILLVVFLFFLGAVFYVKTSIREKNNSTFKIIAKTYMLLLPLFGLWFSGIYLMLAYIYSTIRILFFSSGNKISAKRVGIIEIFNTVWFVVFVVLAYLK